nr:EAL domain-containing protein [Deinococcus alpinitundrae]
MLEPRFASLLKEIGTLGVRTALDDFGNGYSSLTALTNLPVQLVKINRSFTAQVGENIPAEKKALELVRGIVTIATALALPTVVEGVETPEQASQCKADDWTPRTGKRRRSCRIWSESIRSWASSTPNSRYTS